MARDPRTIAARLGIAETTVRRLQARDYLQSLVLSDFEIRLRVYRGQKAFARRIPRRPR